jgi:Protein of unknown function (DUF3592)
MNKIHGMIRTAKGKSLVIALFLLIIFIMAKGYMLKAITNFYYFELLPISKTQGIIVESVKNASWDGTAYHCTIKYELSGKQFTFKELVTFDFKGGLLVGDSIQVVYNQEYPHKASSNSSSYRFLSISFLILFGSAFIYFLFRVLNTVILKRR